MYIVIMTIINTFLTGSKLVNSPTVVKKKKKEFFRTEVVFEWSLECVSRSLRSGAGLLVFAAKALIYVG